MTEINTETLKTELSKGLKVVFIDWDGTSSSSRFWGHWQEGGDERYQRIQENLFVNKSDLVQSWMLGQYSAEEVCQILSALIRVRAPELLENLEESCKQMKFISPETLELIAQIRARGIKVLISTDNMDTFSRWTVPALELDQHYDGILNSFYLKAFKKHKDNFFGEFLRKDDIDPHSCLIIDDSNDNKDPLTEYGFDYRGIERGTTGLVLELRRILDLN